jgi:hypothetical protein
MTIRGNNRLQLGRFEAVSAEHGKRVKRAMMFGDSWFRYPVNRPKNYRPDLAVQLSRHFKGTLFLDEGMPGRDSSHWQVALPRIATAMEAFKFDAILLSIGGNDVVGKELPGVLKRPNDSQVRVPSRFRNPPESVMAYVRLDSFEARLERAVKNIELFMRLRRGASASAPVFLHCYDYVHPNGQPWELRVARLKILERGPWIAPAFKHVGLDSRGNAAHFATAKSITDWMLERFRARLNNYAGEHRGVTVLNTLGTLTGVDMWFDEIHPTKEGFSRLARTHWIPALTMLR